MRYGALGGVERRNVGAHIVQKKRGCESSSDVNDDVQGENRQMCVGGKGREGEGVGIEEDTGK